jgi:exosome complex component RRP42
LSYPLPLLSLTTHLALLSTRTPKLKSELEEDPLFDDDWEAAEFLYPRNKESKSRARPPVTLLVMAVGDNIIFDPSKEELAVAEVVLAVSVGEKSQGSSSTDTEAMEIDSKARRDLRLLSARTIDPPSRLTPPGVPNFLNTATGGSAVGSIQQSENAETEGVWQAPRGGAKRKMIAAMIQRVLERGGVGEEVLDGLETVELG